MKAKKKAFTLFSKEAMDRFRKDRFSGDIVVKWENGVINDLNLTDRCFEFQME